MKMRLHLASALRAGDQPPQILKTPETTASWFKVFQGSLEAVPYHYKTMKSLTEPSTQARLWSWQSVPGLPQQVTRAVAEPAALPSHWVPENELEGIFLTKHPILQRTICLPGHPTLSPLHAADKDIRHHPVLQSPSMASLSQYGTWTLKWSVPGLFSLRPLKETRKWPLASLL